MLRGKRWIKHNSIHEHYYLLNREYVLNWNSFHFSEDENTNIINSCTIIQWSRMCTIVYIYIDNILLLFMKMSHHIKDIFIFCNASFSKLRHFYRYCNFHIHNVPEKDKNKLLPFIVKEQIQEIDMGK